MAFFGMANILSSFQSFISTVQGYLYANHSGNEEELRKICMLYGVLLFGIFFLILFGIIVYIEGSTLHAAINFLSSLFFICLLRLLWVKKCLTFCLNAGISLTYCLLIYLFLDGGVSGNAFLWCYLFPLITFYLLGARKGFMFVLPFFLSCSAILIIDLNTPLINLYDKNLAVRFLPSFLGVILFSLVYENYRENSQKTLIAFNVELEKKIKSRTNELEIQKTRAEKAVEELKIIAITDRLTGLYNRLKLDESLENEFYRAHRYAHQFAVILLDLDFFKSVNDTYGHQEGDQVLMEVAKILQKQVREIDIVGRWGGEEFLIIYPSTNLHGVLSVAEKMRSKIEKYNFPAVGTITASFGVTVWYPDDMIESMIARVDKALYKAKDNGRNRVEVLVA